MHFVTNNADPDKMMIDEEDVIGDLPPLLREEIVGTLYGRQLYSVPLFLKLGTHILTELCLKLVPLPALKGSMIAREGARGTHMFCITSGQVKITEKIKDADDVSRLRDWIEAVFGQANKDIVLIKPTMESMIDQLIICMRKTAKQRTGELQSPQHTAGSIKKAPKRLSDIGRIRSLDKTDPTLASHDSNQLDDSNDEEDEEDEEDELQKRLREALASGEECRVSFKSLLYNDELIELCRETNINLRVLITEAEKRGRIDYRGALELTKANPEGPTITQVGDASTTNTTTPSKLEQLCASLQDGEILIDLLKLLAPRLAANSGIKT